MRNRFFLVFILVAFNVFAQQEEQQALEAKRVALQKEIADINRLLFAKKEQRGNVLDQIQAIDYKVKVRQELISVTNKQSNRLNKEINENVATIAALKKELQARKDEYAALIEKSYQNKSQQNRLLFLLSSEDFSQAFKRLQYIRQYTDYRKSQGEVILEKTEEVVTRNQALVVQRKKADELIAANKRAKRALEREMKSQKDLLQTIKANESTYAQTIKKKKAEAKQIDQQIETLIREAIAAANKANNKEEKTSTSNSSKFVLTPEAAIIASNFSANKGRLIWPVANGIKSQGFGVYEDAIYPGIKHESNGVIISTDEATRARAIFKGEVIAIMSVPGGNKGVTLKHGNYISTYYNLSVVFVKKGDAVDAKDELGKIATNRITGQTSLKFYLYEDTKKLNPEEWVYKL